MGDRARNPNQFEEFLAPGLSVLQLRDPAEWPECPHGRMPLSRPKPGCSCFDGLGLIPKLQPKQRGGSVAHGDRSVRGPEAPRRPRHPVHVKRRAVQLYREGMSSADVAGLFGASPRAVLVWVREAGVPVRRPGGRRAA